MHSRIPLAVAAIFAGLASSYAAFYLRGEAPPPMPPPAPARAVKEAAHFDHGDLDALLSHFVDEAGLVDYAGLLQSRSDLQAWLGRISTYSPDSHPSMFPDENARLAYWLNAYNAWALYLVTEPGSAGPAGEEQLEFFVRRRVRLGGKVISLFDLDHDIIRDRFEDPRVHFALNFGALGGPALQREAFRGERLSEQLDAATRRFCADESKVLVRAGQVEVSALFDWYAQDFDPDGGAIAFCEKWGRAGLPLDGDVAYLPFDWRLNAQPGREISSTSE
jgi:hypothetical protein